MIGRLEWAISPWPDGPDGTRRESRDEHAKRLYSLDQVVGQDFRVRLIKWGIRQGRQMVPWGAMSLIAIAAW